MRLVCVMRALGLAAVLARASLAGAEGRPRYGGVVETALLGAPATLDPVQAAGHAELMLVELVLDTLYRLKLLGPIRERVKKGVPYVGVSAGSNMACPTMKTTNDMPIVAPPKLDALGLEAAGGSAEERLAEPTAGG